MKVIITQREALNVVGMRILTTVEESRIPQLWNDFIVRMDELDDVAVPNCSLGICLNDGDSEFLEDSKFNYMVCKVVKDDSTVPDGMEYREISSQLVAVFTHIGSLETLSETYDYIYDKWLPESEYKLITADEIEWYDSRFKFGEDDSQMDIHIPITKKDSDENDINDGLFSINEN
ncbi:MAG: AraC family transcriptional regulator [Candidatus Cloacimonetes bacterium]|jgi:AraC family transcriptional regulator|nr:AraC family transcriptional regulator [Candidatus Cloacimonadota bacterium]MBT4333424.1 AraC family transcriptional regulator [Candidatus Cloacimonadota bacterium]